MESETSCHALNKYGEKPVFFGPWKLTKKSRDSAVINNPLQKYKYNIKIIDSNTYSLEHSARKTIYLFKKNESANYLLISFLWCHEYINKATKSDVMIVRDRFLHDGAYDPDEIRKDHAYFLEAIRHFMHLNTILGK